jgi:hypothetical protein
LLYVSATHILNQLSECHTFQRVGKEIQLGTGSSLQCSDEINRIGASICRPHTELFHARFWANPICMATERTGEGTQQADGDFLVRWDRKEQPNRLEVLNHASQPYNVKCSRAGPRATENG